MKKIIIFLFALFCVAGAKAQSDTIETPPEIAPPPKPEQNEKMPEFPGGREEMNKFISKNVVYPKKAIKEKISGTVKVSFMVEKDGSLSDIKVISKEIGGGCDEEALRVVQLFPKFTPGIQNGNPAKVKMVVPIRFRLK